MSLEMPTNVYENRPNEEALKQQRTKYIQEELQWFGTNEGAAWLHWLEEVKADGGQEEATEMDNEEVIDELIDKILTRVYRKTVSNKESQEEWEKFKAEFPRQEIREQLIEAEFISRDGQILVFEENTEE